MQDGWFYWNQVQEMSLHALLEAVVYQAQGDKVEVLPRHWHKRSLVINTVAFL